MFLEFERLRCWGFEAFRAWALGVERVWDWCDSTTVSSCLVEGSELQQQKSILRAVGIGGSPQCCIRGHFASKALCDLVLFLLQVELKAP